MESIRENCSPGLLISVQNVREAEWVLQQAIQILDIKAPGRGALGRVSLESAGAIYALFHRWQSSRAETNGPALSIALGELRDIANSGLSVGWVRLLKKFRYAKAGLHGVGRLHDWTDSWYQLRRQIAPCQLVPVAYLDYHRADSPPPEQVVQFARDSKSTIILFDTFSKVHGDFTEVIPEPRLRELADTCANHAIKVALAGSVKLASLTVVRGWVPGYIGVRGAVCRGDRAGEIDPVRLAEFVQRSAAWSGSISGRSVTGPVS